MCARQLVQTYTVSCIMVSLQQHETHGDKRQTSQAICLTYIRPVQKENNKSILPGQIIILGDLGGASRHDAAPALDVNFHLKILCHLKIAHRPNWLPLGL